MFDGVENNGRTTAEYVLRLFLALSRISIPILVR